MTEPQTTISAPAPIDPVHAKRPPGEQPAVTVALDRRHAELASLVNAAPIGLAILDRQMQYQVVNQRMAQMNGATVQQHLGRPLRQVIPQLADAVEQQLRESIATATPTCNCEIRGTTASQPGVWRDWLADYHPIKAEDGTVRSICMIIREVTKRKRAEAVVRRLKITLDQRVAERTAELRALAAELNNSEQRERRRIAAELHDYLAQQLVLCKMKIHMLTRSTLAPGDDQNLDEVSTLLDDAHRYTRTLMAELSPAVLYELGLIPAFQWLADRMLEHHGLSAHIEAEEVPNLPDDLAILIFQAVRELLINVVKHAQVNQACVGINYTPDELTIVVHDAGVGFDVENHPIGAMTGHFGLFGLHQRLQAIDGRFEIQSAPQRGTRAAVVVPIPHGKHELGETQTANAAAGTALTPNRSSEVIRVLLADDQQLVRDGLRKIIESSANLQVVGEADDGQRAIEQAHLLHPDVIVMDVNMPQMNGIEATRKIKYDLPAIDVIALSIRDDPITASAMKEAGATTYLSKSSAAEELCQAIHDTRV